MTEIEIEVFQERAFEEWRVGVNAYWQRTGKPQRAAPGWPYQARAEVGGVAQNPNGEAQAGPGAQIDLLGGDLAPSAGR